MLVELRRLNCNDYSQRARSEQREYIERRAAEEEEVMLIFEGKSYG